MPLPESFRPRRVKRPNLERRILSLLVVTAAGLSTAGAADFEFLYDAALSWYYSQDVLRTGTDQVDDYVTTARVTAVMNARTPRSLTSLRYAPEYAWYEEFDSLDALDHRLGTSWRLDMSPVSTFEIRQGLSDTTRQVGFQDLSGVGGNTSEPVTARSRRIVWDVEPRLRLVRSPGTTATFEAIYREENYDLPTLIDSRQAGAQAAFEKNIGRAQYLGGRLRADKYSFDIPDITAAPFVAGYDQFLTASVSWARRIDEGMTFEAGAGAYRSTGPNVAAVIRPTLDLAGHWAWQRVRLSLEYELSYASGGGISTSNRSQWGHVAFAGTWGDGFEAGMGAGYIHRGSPEARFGDERPLAGRSGELFLSKRWHSGLGMFARVSDLRQERQIGPDLHYREAIVGVTFSPSTRERDPMSPEGYTPRRRGPRTPRTETP